MRTFALAVAGLAALAQALPTGSDASALQERQFKIGEPDPGFIVPGNSPVPPKKEYKVPGYPQEPSFQIGKRELAKVDGLEATYESLASQYTSRPPPLSTYLLLQQLAGILAANGHPPSTIVLGPATTHLQISSRQVFGIGGGCSESDLIPLLLLYSSLQSLYGSNPPSQIRSLKEAVYAALKYCNMDPEVGGIVPNKPIPGAPITPDRPVPGAPLTPDKPSTGAPMVPGS
jgi:hypothetical protein